MLNGYGEGVCLIITQLLDKYLVNQNFIFKKPQLEVFSNLPKYDDDFIEPEITEEVGNSNSNGIVNEKPEKIRRFGSGKSNGNTEDFNFSIYLAKIR